MEGGKAFQRIASTILINFIETRIDIHTNSTIYYSQDKYSRSFRQIQCVTTTLIEKQTRAITFFLMNDSGINRCKKQIGKDKRKTGERYRSAIEKSRKEETIVRTRKN